MACAKSSAFISCPGSKLYMQVRGCVLQADPQTGVGSLEAPPLRRFSLATQPLLPLLRAVTSLLGFPLILCLMGVASPLRAAVLVLVLVLILLIQKEASLGSILALLGSGLLSLPEKTSWLRRRLPP